MSREGETYSTSAGTLSPRCPQRCYRVQFRVLKPSELSVAVSLTLLSPRDWNLGLVQDTGVTIVEGELAVVAQAWNSNNFEVEGERSDVQVRPQFHRVGSAWTTAVLTQPTNQPTSKGR